MVVAAAAVAAAVGTAVSAATDRLAADEFAVAVAVAADVAGFAVAGAAAQGWRWPLRPWLVAARSLHRHLRWTASLPVMGLVWSAPRSPR